MAGITPQTISTLSTAAPRRPAGAGPLSPWLAAALGFIVPTALAYLLATGNETQIFAAVIALAGLLLIFARPFWGLVLFVCLLYTRPEEIITALAGMRFTLLISVVTLIAMIFQMCLNKQAFVRNPINGLIVGFGAMVVVSTFANGNTAEAAQEIGKLVILVLLILNLVRTPDSYRSLVSAIIVFTAYLAIYASYLYFNGGALGAEATHSEARSQATGIFNNPNDLAATIVPGLALTLCRLFGARSWQRYSYASLALVMVWAILLTHSRGGLLAMMAVSVVCCFIQIRNKKAAILVAVALAGAIFGASSGRMREFDSGEESANSRFHFWGNATDQFVAHPLTGVGYENFINLNGGMASHNSFVTCFVETGLPGYFCWFGCIYFCFRRKKSAGPIPASEGLPQPAPPGARADLAAARIALLGYLVESFTSNHTYIPVLYLLMSAAIASHLVEKPAVGPAAPAVRMEWNDVGRILAMCLVSIAIIDIIAVRMK